MSVTITNAKITGGVQLNGQDPAILYTFTNFTFAYGNIIGSTSGTRAQFLANYNTAANTWLNNTSYYNITTPGFQIWTVPQTGTYEIEVGGSKSGSSSSYGWTFGTKVRGRFALTQGTSLTIVAGSYPAGLVSASSFQGTGGGGGSFVVRTATNTPLIIAGGAGGLGRYGSSSDGNTSAKNGLVGTTTSGTSSRNILSSFANGAPGGTLGQGGNSHVSSYGIISVNNYDSGAGGGFYSNGVNGAGGNVRTNATNGSTGGGGQGWNANLIGGVAASSYLTTATPGGFGGGGGASPICGGGGGGYSGGGGAYSSAGATTSDGGGGGGCYIDASATAVATSNGLYDGLSTFGGSSITNIGTYNNDGGYIKITLI